MSSKEIQTALVGIGGYGEAYLNSLLFDPRTAGSRFVAAVDPFPHHCRRIDELRSRSIPIYSHMEELFASHQIDLTMIVTPIHLHPSQTVYAMRQGANVLCEKPLGGSLRDARIMLDTQQATGKFAAIGFQWSFSAAIQSLKADIMRGLFGKPVRMRTLVFFPRPRTYFHRNDWAGRITTTEGELVLDSPVNNATSHYLHNMFYLLGSTRQGSALPATVQAELYRANEIENYDTAALRCRTSDGVEILFYTTHAVPHVRGPVSSYEFEDATIEYDATAGGQFIARFPNGENKNYGSPNTDRNEKIWQAIESARTGSLMACGIEGALPHAQCVLAAQKSSPEIIEFPADLHRAAQLDGQPMTWIEGLAETFSHCYDRGILPSEAAPWARPASIIDLQPSLEARVFPRPQNTPARR